MYCLCKVDKCECVFSVRSEALDTFGEHAVPDIDQNFVILLHLRPVDVELAHCFVQDRLAKAYTGANEAVSHGP